MNGTSNVKPLLKWAGGKRSIADKLAREVGTISGRYYEPFAGGAALFFRLGPERAVLGDLNAEVVNCYSQVKQRHQELARKLATMENSEAAYYRIRNSRPTSNVGKAARMIYLTTLAFNGIYRQNLEGRHNVPYGYKYHLSLPDEKLLENYSSIFAKASLRCGDFAKTVADAVDGDVIYFDPPYTVAHNNNGFVKYNDKIFSWDDQKRLAQLAAKLRDRGCRVLVSNANHESIRALYTSFREVIIERSSVIAASSEHRKLVTESLFIGCRVG